ncbi:hypothetical protein [Aliiruegeria sabulilitoris]|uniref:hypothetical protein n=1 Tax=Aliiruegeria sabulilitoris TaxID=1510458 RepID=UPI0008365A19|nr:hypothetical protein [Aliiruegeria sabulilitoris]NDR56598.1 hypothetical protein [Pseudoruegeria sp. M32A2M]
MHRNTKLATCCYCGMRATLVLGEDRHSLACGGCGAPLSDLKSLPSGKTTKTSSANKTAPFDPRSAKKTKSKKRSKPKKPSFRRVFGDILDEIEDIFD